MSTSEDARASLGDDIKLTKYRAITEKGRYTYRYFQLKKLEVNSLNTAQGISLKNDEDVISEEATDEIKKTLEFLLSKTLKNNK